MFLKYVNISSAGTEHLTLSVILAFFQSVPNFWQSHSTLDITSMINSAKLKKLPEGSGNFEKNEVKTLSIMLTVIIGLLHKWNRKLKK